ncbi:hypothetical protein NLI96_g355 [Meripilus lineatus]|uniref:Uncharacterized protein n=1 Tax=Meripilus lineatus TaxID=2056292 RepID=A0AAD5VCQ4_9APHY|nr:hypothetical protein NLI96_g355 [Physisporinus lineatus]
MSSSRLPDGHKVAELRFGPSIPSDAVDETLRKLFGDFAEATPTEDGGLSFKFDSPDWMDYTILDEDFIWQQVVAMTSASQIFLKLGNTGAAVHRQKNALTTALLLPEDKGSPKFLRRKRALEDEARDLWTLRHPDPKFLQLGLQDSELQVLGSWKKIELSKANNLTARYSVGTFVWRSRFYVCGGEKSLLGPFYRDFHYLDLEKLDRWRSLPSYPVPESITGICIGWRMWVHDDKAYLFNGSTLVDYFDLITEEWHQIRTTWVPSNRMSSFPFTKEMLVDFAVAYARGKAYFFGGTHRSCALGCPLFTCLDLTTQKWQLLSGEHCPIVPQFDSPGPRRLPAMWVNGAGDRIYLMFGEADRPGATVAKQPHGQTSGHGYEDFWSWGIQEGSWRRERQPGNAPCPRSESSYSYVRTLPIPHIFRCPRAEYGLDQNPVLDKTFIFGGYHPSIPTFWPEQHAMFNFSYYADTFMYDDGSTSGSTPVWKHVVTSGFPTYRAQSEMFTDPDTGKIYLFGGYTNSQFVPQRKSAIMRTFNDLWQLRLDIPGGFFEGVDLEEEARTARAGPWQKCYNCGNTGPWKKCGGILQVLVAGKHSSVKRNV